MSDDLAIQHPPNADGTWQAHCCRCGTYTDDDEIEPPIDFLCDDCMERGDDE